MLQQVILFLIALVVFFYSFIYKEYLVIPPEERECQKVQSDLKYMVYRLILEHKQHKDEHD